MTNNILMMDCKSEAIWVSIINSGQHRMTKYFLILFSCFFCGNPALAQSKKDIRKNNVKTMTETVTNYENGKEVTINDAFRRFDKNGEVIEEINYDKNGKVKSKTVSKFKDEDKVEETMFDANGKQLSREVYKYDIDGDKAEELHYNAQNELESRSVYTNKRGLKTERKTYDAKGKLVQVKKYGYQ